MLTSEHLKNVLYRLNAMMDENFVVEMVCRYVFMN